MQKIPLQRVRAITFDMYGTLLDLEASFAPGFSEFLKGKGYPGSASEVVQAWEIAYLHECNVDSLLGRARTPFEVVRRLTLSQLFFKFKIEHTMDDIEQLVTTLATPSLFPDVKENLTRLQGRYDMSVLSNGDLASLDRAVSGLGIPVDRAISAEQAGLLQAPTRGLPTRNQRIGRARQSSAPRCGPRLGYPGCQGGRHGRGLYQPLWDSLRRCRWLPGRSGSARLVRTG